MRVLFQNKAEDAGITALYENANYPVSNLVSRFLRKRFQSTANSDTVTIDFGAITAISSVFYGYTNATSVTINVYDGVTLLETCTDLDCFSFPEVQADKVEIVLTASSPVYLGGVGVGVAYELPPPSSFWTESYQDRSLVSESQSGQVLQEYVEPLIGFDFAWNMLSRDQARGLLAQYKAVGVGRPLWIAPETDDIDPLYARITDAMGASKDKRRYSVRMNIREAR